jgi:uncharacterized paraquat-inducible protein A
MSQTVICNSCETVHYEHPDNPITECERCGSDQHLMAKPTLYETCVNIYEKFGQSGVFDYINREHPEVSWKVCKPCESESPTDEGICLVCGSLITEYEDEADPDERAIKIIEGAISHFVAKNQSHVPLGVLNDILDQLVYTNDTEYIEPEDD